MRLPTITGEFRLTDDPELRFTPSGKAVCNVTIIASESKKNDAGGWDDGDKTPFINVSLWDKAAEAAAEELTRGERVLVTGALYVREYDKRDGSGKGQSIELKYATVAGVPGGKSKAERSQGYSAATPPARTAAADPWATPTNTDKPPF